MAKTNHIQTVKKYNKWYEPRKIRRVAIKKKSLYAQIDIFNQLRLIKESNTFIYTSNEIFEVVNRDPFMLERI